MRSLIIISISLFLAACAVPKTNYQPEAIYISEPPIDSINVKRVGDELLRQGKYVTHEAITVASQVAISAYTVHPGYFLKLGEDESAAFYRIGGGGPESGHVTKSWYADPYQSLMIEKETKKLCIVTIMNVYGCGDEALGGNVSETKVPVLTQDAVQQTLIYSGKIGNKINIGYREFSGNFARPAFSNNVEYDLSESSEIGYKGALINIIEATNQHIKYKVMSNFNGAAR